MNASIANANPRLTLLEQQLEPLRKVEKSKLQARTLPLVRTWLDLQREAIRLDFMEEGPHKGNAGRMLESYSLVMDSLLIALYRLVMPKNATDIAIAAVGGYGRGELFPYSDVDLLFIYDAHHAAEAARIAEFILYILWDCGLKVGQSHRDIDDTIAKAKEDISIRTSLLDARFIAGEQPVFDHLVALIVMTTSRRPDAGNRAGWRPMGR